MGKERYVFNVISNSSNSARLDALADVHTFESSVKGVDIFNHIVEKFMVLIELVIS